MPHQGSLETTFHTAFLSQAPSHDRVMIKIQGSMIRSPASGSWTCLFQAIVGLVMHFNLPKAPLLICEMGGRTPTIEVCRRIKLICVVFRVMTSTWAIKVNSYKQDTCELPDVPGGSMVEYRCCVWKALGLAPTPATCLACRVIH